MSAGVIYILTNPSFPDYVKIGYADNVEDRLAQLNRSECIPFSFRVYATYEVESRLSDKKIHSIIDKLNPDLRSIETVKGKTRVREFYAMPPEDAYEILEAIAEIHGFEGRLKKIAMDEMEKKEKQTAEAVHKDSIQRAANFQFSMCGLKPGDRIEYFDNPAITVEVADDKHVIYNGQVMSLTAAAKMISGIKHNIAGPAYFKYNGEWLNTIRHRNGY